MADKTAWFPLDYCDEVMPDDRDSPSAWITRGGDSSFRLAQAFGDEDEPEGQLLTDGTIVQFCARHDYGTAQLELLEGGGYRVDRAMPPEAELVFAMEGWGADSLSNTVADLVHTLVVNLGADPGTFQIVYYTFTSGIPFRFVEATGTFEKVS